MYDNDARDKFERILEDMEILAEQINYSNKKLEIAMDILKKWREG